MQEKIIQSKIDEIKIKQNLIWNYISLFFLGISGIGINICIGFNFKTEILGAFNLVLITYLIIAIFASGGINFSVLRALAENQDKKNVKDIIKGALIPSFFLGIFFTCIYFNLIDFISNLFSSENVRIGMVFATPAIIFFSLNKIMLLGVINGMGRMRAFSIYQTTRYLGLIISLLLVLRMSKDGSILPIIFLFAELFLFIILFMDISINYKWWRSKNWFKWTKIHLSFGFKSLLSSIFIEMNTRIDIFMLGIFLSDEIVGIYSFAALFAEGFLQIFVVLQNNFNPILANLINKNNQELINFIFRVRRKTYKLISLLGIIAIAIYPFLITFITNKPEFENSYFPFIIIIMGILISSGYLPFQNILIMFNRPTAQTYVIICVALTNILLNSLLIPIFGIKGAALGTSLATISSIYITKYFVSKEVNLKI